MQIEEKIKYIIPIRENIDLLKNYNCYTLLDISEPLMFVLNELDVYYFAYTLQNRIAILNNGSKAEVVELLVVETDIYDIKALLEGNKDIKDVLLKDSMYRIGKIGRKIYPKKFVDKRSYIEERIPQPGIRLNGRIPNKINLKSTLKKIQNDADFYNEFTLKGIKRFNLEPLQVSVERLSVVKVENDSKNLKGIKLRNWGTEVRRKFEF